MREPGFWYRSPGLASALLSPLGYLYATATRRRLAAGPRRSVPVPVICVGNINVGGTGKTPTVIELVARLSAFGVAPHVLSRGYGGSLAGPVRVDLTQHSAAEVGDEPLLIAPFAPVWIGSDRITSAQAALEAGAELLILDDGHQNPALKPNLSIVVADATRGFGNGKVLPAGPLREPVSAGLARADLLLIIGDRDAQHPTLANADLPRLHGQLVPVETGMDWSDISAVAFAGIGHPEKFFHTLHDLGVKLVGTHALDDHQKLERPLLQRLIQEAAAKGAQLITTEKDAVRIPADLRAGIFSLPVRLSVTESDRLDQTLRDLIS